MQTVFCIMFSVFTCVLKLASCDSLQSVREILQVSASIWRLQPQTRLYAGFDKQSWQQPVLTQSQLIIPWTNRPTTWRCC